MDKHFTSYQIDDRSYVAFVKREIHNSLLQRKFPKTKIAEIDIIIAELTSNLIKHAGGGEILVRLSNDEGLNTSLEIIGLDSGPGMDVTKMMKDGVSTKNTLGQGLGAIQRLSSLNQTYSLPRWGTVSYTVVSSSDAPVATLNAETKILTVPKPKEIVCGDGYGVIRDEHRVKVFLGDGLGHGEFAKEAVDKAKEFFLTSKEEDPVDIIRQMHLTVRKTRGLVATVAVLDVKKRAWKICGVGNILTRLYAGMMFKHYMSYNGIVGLNIPNSLNCSVMEAEKNQQLIMCSDGIRSRWDLTKYPSILKYDPMILASALYKDFTRRNDDSSILISKFNLAS